MSMASSTASSNGTGNKIFPKLQKMPTSTTVMSSISRQDTINESIESDKKLTITTTATTTTPTATTSATEVPVVESKALVRAGGEAASSSYIHTTHLPSVEYKEILSTLMDLKVDIRLEVQKLNQKMTRLEDMIGDIINRLASANTTPSTPPNPGDQPLTTPTTTAATMTVVSRKRRSKSRTKAPEPPPTTQSLVSASLQQIPPGPAPKCSPEDTELTPIVGSPSHIEEDKRPFRRNREFL